MGTITVYRDRTGILKAKISGGDEEYSIIPLRCFPFTHAQKYISLREVKSGGRIGKEVALVVHFEELDEDSRQLVDEELSKHHSFSFIRKIHSIRKVERIWEWNVNTDRRNLTIEVEDEKDVYMMNSSTVVVKDRKEQTFLIEYNQLNSKSQTLIEPFL